MRARRTASAKIRRADAVTRTDIVSCVTCELRDRCRDPRKSKMFACAAWLEQVDKNDDPSTRDFARSMRELVQRESVVPDPYAIDDRDSPAAPNSYAWACGEQFLNYQPSPYPKQLELCINLFSDKCSYCRGSWYEDIPHDCDIAEIPRRIMLRQFGRCPRCHRTRLDGIRDGREKDYNGLLAVVGQRGGKSASLSIIDSYQMHMLLKIKNPSAFYGIKTGTVLYNTIVGTTYGGAKSNVYDPLLASVQESPWFNSYGELLRDVAQKRGHGPGRSVPHQGLVHTLAYRRAHVRAGQPQPPQPERQDADRIRRGRARPFRREREAGEHIRQGGVACAHPKPVHGATADHASETGRHRARSTGHSRGHQQPLQHI